MQLTSGIYKKKYTKMFYANILGWLVTLIGETGDTLIAGIFLGETAVAGIELAASAYNALYFVASLLAQGGSLLFGREQGSNNSESASKKAGMLGIVAIAAGIISFAVMRLGMNAYFAFFTDGGEIVEAGMGFYKALTWMALGYCPFWALYFLVNMDGDEMAVLCADITATVMNIVLNIILCKKYGTLGIGIGTGLSLLMASVFLIVHLFKKNNSIKFKAFFNFKVLGEMAVLGSNTSMSTLCLALSALIFNKFIIVRLGEEYLIAFAVVSFGLEMANCLLAGMNAAEPFVSNFFGEKNYPGIEKIMRRCTRFTFISGVLLALIFIVIAPYFPAWYGIEDPAMYQLGSFSLRAMSVGMLAASFAFEFAQYYVELDHFVLGNTISFMRNFVLQILLAIPAAILWGYKGMVWGFVLNYYLIDIGFGLFVRKRFGKDKFPFILPDASGNIYEYEFAVTDEEIAEVQKRAADVLRTEKIPDDVSEKVQLMIEESFQLIKSKNEGRKVLACCTLFADSNRLTLVMKDDGVVFDITDPDNKIKSLRDYVVSCLMTGDFISSNITSVSFNKNVFVWDI